MQFDSFSAFLNMGGYGFYVWLSFGVSTVLILALLISSVLGHKNVIKTIAIRHQREEKLRQVRKKSKKTTVKVNTKAVTEEVAQ